MATLYKTSHDTERRYCIKEQLQTLTTIYRTLYFRKYFKCGQNLY